MDDLRITQQIKNDGWQNILTGLGGKADKTKATKMSRSIILSDQELESIYMDDGIGSRIVDLLPEDMVRQGWKYDFANESSDVEQISREYDTIFEKIKLESKLAEAMKWARLYGGAVILIGALDGQELDKPIIPKKIKDIENLKIIPRPDIQYSQIKFQMDSSKPGFGEPEMYAIELRIGDSYKIINVHKSRIIELHGISLPKSGTSYIPAEYRYWGINCLQRVYDRLANLGGSFGSIANLLSEVSVGKYKMRDLADILSAPDGDKLVQHRIQSMDLMKSTFHSIFMDTEEDYTRENVAFGGVSDVMYQFMMLISACTGYPMTRLFGISPAGLNSTGEGDIYNYYDMVKAKQKTELKPIINRLVNLISQWRNLPVPEILFNPLEQMTEKEEAELEAQKANTAKVKMETYQGYIDMGIMEPYMVEDIEFGDSLKNIKVPEDYEMPPVEDIDSLTSKIQELENKLSNPVPQNVPPAPENEPEETEIPEEKSPKKKGGK